MMITDHIAQTSAADSHAGRRPYNEDAYLELPRLGLYVVCDGMGGYEGGEVASALAISTIAEFFEAQARDEELTWPFALEGHLTMMENMVATSVRLADMAVQAERKGTLQQMGTTVVLMVIAGNEIVIGHLGDSRCYRLREGSLVQLTRDHSLYQELVSAGAHDLGPLSEFRGRNVITRALGMGQAMMPTMHRELWLPNDRYLLCSDGLTESLDNEAIAEFLAEGTPRQACRALIEAAYEAGSHDNITALVLDQPPG